MICAVIDKNTKQQVNLIVAEITDEPPKGCFLVELPLGFYWNGSDVVKMEIVDGD